MQKLKLSELLLSFNSNELKRLVDFINSPFYNKNKKLISLIDLFRHHIENSSFNTLTKEFVWKNILSGEKFSDVKLRSYLSDLKKLCEKFIITLEEEKNAVRSKNLLLQYLTERNLKKNTESVSSELKNAFNSEFTKSFEHYYEMMFFERAVILNEGRNVEKNLDGNYYRLSDAIDHYFISSKLDLMNSFLSRKYHVLGSFRFKTNFTDEILKYTEDHLQNIKRNDPFIYCEYLIFKMMTAENNDEYFKDLHGFVLKNIRKYKHSELEQVYFPMINFGFNKVAMGETDYLLRIFEIYRTFELRGFYSDMDVFQDIDLISIVIAGLRLNKISWVESFIEKYSPKLINEFRSDTVSLVYALTSFKKKDYSGSIKYLSGVNYQNSYYYLKSKETLMIIYYEQGEYVAMQSLMDSVRHYLKRRRDVLSIHYERYMMFLKYLSMLLKAVQNDKSNKVLLKKELRKNINVIAREWLIEKVNDL